jgi:hypothetical protein
MGTYIKKRQKPGTGTCSTPRCEAPKSRGSNFCLPCKHRLKDIKQDFESDPRLLYMQRSDNRDRRFLKTGATRRAGGKRPSLPVCCKPGCYELRVPPDPYCGGTSCSTIID